MSCLYTLSRLQVEEAIEKAERKGFPVAATIIEPIAAEGGMHMWQLARSM